MAHHQAVDAKKKRATGQRKDADVREFILRFAGALTAGDEKKIATLWQVPALVLSDQGTHAVSSREEVETFFSGARDQYTARGIHEARPEIELIDWLTDRIAMVKVRWPYIDVNGREIGEESSTYTLRCNDEDALQLCAVVMHGAKETH